MERRLAVCCAGLSLWKIQWSFARQTFPQGPTFISSSAVYTPFGGSRERFYHFRRSHD